MKGNGLPAGLAITAGALALLLIVGSADAEALVAQPRPPLRPPPPPQPGPTDWRYRVLRAISAHEGEPASVQRNLDGNGASFGILQWTQKAGGLAIVLRELHQRAPARTEAVFGGAATLARLQAHLDERSLGPLDGAMIWDPPWLGRFQAAGHDPALAALQWEIAAESDYIRAIPKIAAALGLRSERAYALIGNRTVHQGVGGTWRAARTLLAHWEGHGGPVLERERLSAFAWTCGLPFRAETTRPTRGLWRWVQPEHVLSAAGTLVTRAEGAWHAMAGPWDLWELIVQRSAQILADPQWSDGPV